VSDRSNLSLKFGLNFEAELFILMVLLFEVNLAFLFKQQQLLAIMNLSAYSY
jgi:hypothetical protein